MMDEGTSGPTKQLEASRENHGQFSSSAGFD